MSNAPTSEKGRVSLSVLKIIIYSTNFNSNIHRLQLQADVVSLTYCLARLSVQCIEPRSTAGCGRRARRRRGSSPHPPRSPPSPLFIFIYLPFIHRGPPFRPFLSLRNTPDTNIVKEPAVSVNLLCHNLILWHDAARITAKTLCEMSSWYPIQLPTHDKLNIANYIVTDAFLTVT